MGVDRAHVSAIERGLQNATLLTILQAAQALSVRPAELLEDGPPHVRADIARGIVTARRRRPSPASTKGPLRAAAKPLPSGRIEPGPAEPDAPVSMKSSIRLDG